MYSHVTNTCIKTWVVRALPSKYPTIQQWNCYPEFQHHRLVLPVLELHLYGIIQYVILCLSSFCSASCEVHPAAFWSFLHLLSSVVVNDYASIFTLLFLKIIFFLAPPLGIREFQFLHQGSNLCSVQQTRGVPTSGLSGKPQYSLSCDKYLGWIQYCGCQGQSCSEDSCLFLYVWGGHKHSFLLGTHPGENYWAHLELVESAEQFSKREVSLQSQQQGRQTPALFPDIVLRSSHCNHSDVSIVLSHCGFNSHFSND